MLYVVYTLALFVYTECNMDTHTDADHDMLKLDALAWTTLELVGVQVLPAWQDEPEERAECRNCSCGTTLAVAVTS